MSQGRSILARAAALLIVAGSLALAGWKGLHPVPTLPPGSTRPPPSGPVPEDIPPAPTTKAPSEEFLGVILARVSADIAPRFEGKLQEVRVRLGDHVSAGDVLAVLDAPALHFDLRQAEANLSTAGVDQARSSIELSEAKERLGRRRSLAAEHLTSDEDLASAGYQEQLAAARLAAARAQVQERQFQVERLRKDNHDLWITAPFDGIVAIRYVDPGATVRPSTPIVRLISMRDAFVRFAAPESQARAMAVGQVVRIYVGTARRKLHGTIEKIAPEVDAASHLVFLEARLPALDPDFPVLSGEIARVSRMESP